MPHLILISCKTHFTDSHEMIPALINKTVLLVRARRPDDEINIHYLKGVQRVDLPFAPTAEYRLRLWFFENGEREIQARLINEDLYAMSSPLYFWHYPFELSDFHNSPEELAERFDKDLIKLLHMPTRIRQRRGWFLWYFCLEGEERRAWTPFYAHAALRGFRVPAIEGRERVYEAPAVA
jgi:hypothetical protein